MRQIMTVCAYTFKEGIRKKAFWISSVLIAVLILALCLIPRVISLFQPEEEKTAEDQTQTEAVAAEKEGTCYFLDETGIFAGELPLFEALAPNLEFKEIETEPDEGGEEPAQLEEIRKDIKENEQNAAIYIYETEKEPAVKLLNGSFLSRDISLGDVLETCNLIWQTKVLTEAGVSQETVSNAQRTLTGGEETVGEMSITGYILGIAVTILMFFAVYYYGYGVAMSVASEKTSRVMETLIISAKPSRILLGKCIAMGAVGLLQIFGLSLVAVLGYTFLVPGDLHIAGLDFSMDSFSPAVVGILFVYFILGYGFYAIANSVCGAAVSKIEDLNSAMLPASLIAVAGFYLGYFTSIAGGGSHLLGKIALYLPISSPFSVPFRLLTGNVTGRDLGISMLILIVSIVVIAVISSKIYSASVMHYGKRLKWKDAAKMKI